MRGTSESKSRYDQLDSDGSRKVAPIHGPSTGPKVGKGASVEVVNGIWFLRGLGWARDVTRWNSHAELRDATQYAFQVNSASWRPTTANTRASELDVGFFGYIQSSEAYRNLKLSDIDSAFMRGFVKWLGRKQANGAPVWTPGTRAGILSAVRGVFKTLKKSKVWRDQVHVSLVIPTHAWPGRGRGTTPRSSLDASTLSALIAACHQEVTLVTRELQQVWAEIETIDGGGEAAEAINSWQAVWCARHKATFKDCLPDSNELARACPALSKVYLTQIRRGWTFASVRRPIAPTVRDLVPFVLLLAFVCSFNADTTRVLKFSEIDYVETIGGRRIRFRPYKPRGKRTQLRTFPLGVPMGPDELVDTVTKWTQHIRTFAPPQFSDHLFLAVVKNAGRGPKRSFQTVSDLHSGATRAGAAWYNALAEFLEDHDLPPMQLAELRPTSLDIVHEATHGDLKAVQAAGGQRSQQVIKDHYTSAAAKKRNDEMLVTAMLGRERLVARKGAAADPRKEPYTSDVGAATPGFGCIDPFDSPITGEVGGRLCQAYAQCPACAHGCIDRNDPYAAARVLQLRELVLQAQSVLAAQRWLSAWAPVLKRLDEYWLLLFSGKVLSAAAALSVPPLPDLE